MSEDALLSSSPMSFYLLYPRTISCYLSALLADLSDHYILFLLVSRPGINPSRCMSVSSIENLAIPKRQKVFDKTFLPAGDALPVWHTVPLDHKLPVPPSPRGSYTLYTNKVLVYPICGRLVLVVIKVI